MFRRVREFLARFEQRYGSFPVILYIGCDYHRILLDFCGFPDGHHLVIHGIPVERRDDMNPMGLAAVKRV